MSPKGVYDRAHAGGIGLKELRARTKPGECPFCGDSVKRFQSGKPQQTCGAPECFKSYPRFYYRDRRAKVPGQ